MLDNCFELVDCLLSHGAEPQKIHVSTIVQMVIAKLARRPSELGLTVLYKLLAFPQVTVEEFVNGMLRFPDVLFAFLKNADHVLRLAIKDTFPELHLDIEWDVFGMRKLDLIKLLLNDLEYDINAKPVTRYRKPLVFILLNLKASELNDKIISYVCNYEKVDLEIQCYYSMVTPPEYAITNNSFNFAVKLIKAGAKLTKKRIHIVHSTQFTSLVKAITFRGLDYRHFLEFRTNDSKCTGKAIRHELDLVNLWIDTVPKRRGTLMELTAIKLREQLTSARLMQLIGDREVDSIVKFFAQEIYFDGNFCHEIQ